MKLTKYEEIVDGLVINVEGGWWITNLQTPFSNDRIFLV